MRGLRSESEGKSPCFCLRLEVRLASALQFSLGSLDRDTHDLEMCIPE
jgi:hypothetical protein